MKSSHFKSIILTVWILILVYISQVYPEQVIKYKGAAEKLKEKWHWALKTAKQQKFAGPFWTGYSIERLMCQNSYIGCFRSDDEDAPSLRQIINHIHRASKSNFRDDDDYTRKTIRHSSKDREESCEKVLKEVAILFKCSIKKKRELQILDVSITNMSLYFDLEDLPLIWLGKARHSESIGFLEDLYDRHPEVDVKKEIITAIGIHQNPKQVTRFLKSVLLSKDDNELRENSAFWLGQQDSQEALDILNQVARTDRASDVREKAVFGIYLMKLKTAMPVLIDLARHAKHTEVRRKAIFWLSQKASRNVSKVIEDIAFSDEETEIQKQAVFALSQLPNDESVPRLIKVAKTHPNFKIRKKAIFWLGQSHDERALEALIEFVKGNQ